MEDDIIVRELAKQNEDAFDWLFDKYYARMVAHAHIILQDEAEAKDVVQELLVKLLEFKGWHNVADLRSYVIRSAHNIALHRIAALKRTTINQEEYTRSTQDAWIDTSPLQLLRDELSLQQKITYLLSLLSPQRRQAFKLVYLEGRSYAETARIMGVAKNTIKTHLKLGMKVLRNAAKGVTVLIVLLVQCVKILPSF